MRLILHAGTHKTGTTSIQKALSCNRGWLRAHGLFYPVLPPFEGNRPHHNFSHALASGRPEDMVKAHAFIDAIEAEAKEGETVILSSEAIYRHVPGGAGFAGLVASDYREKREAYLRSLAGLLERFDVDVVLCFRDYGYFLSWLHRLVTRENVWQGDAATFQKVFAERFEYERELALFHKVFPAVHSYSYEDAKQAGVIRYFFDFIGFPVPPGADDIWERPTRKPITPL